MASVTATTPIEEEVSEKTVDENAECYICHKVGHVSRGCPDRVCPVCKKGGDEGNHPIRECPMKAEKKKSKKPGRKKTHAARARQIVNGFEDGYADAPVTPAEFEHEHGELYTESRPICDRIEFAIQRYRSKRRFDEFRKNVFDSYLRLGGIEAGQNTFTGGFDQDTLAGMSAEEIQTAQASDYISDAVLAADLDRNNLKDRLAQNEDVWAVDFTAIVKAFLSQHVPYVMCISAPEKQLEAAEMIKNFLNYLLQHDVAPEYEADILAARKICDKAFSEIPSCLRVSKLLPGTFNKACSTLYGGEYQGMYQRHEVVGSKTLRNPGMEAEEAIKIIKFTMVAMGQLKTKDDLAAAKKGFHVVETKTCGAEVVSIDLLPPEEKKIFEETKKQAGVEAEVLGRVRFREWDEPAHEAENVDESESEDDDDDEGAGGKRLAKRAAEWEIWLEVSLLESFFVGLKLFATWQRLNNGVWYLDEVTGCLVSFYTYLPLNERLKERAAHRGAAAGLLEPGKDGAGAVGDPGAAGEWDDYVEGDAERAMEKLKLEGGVDMDITIVGEEEAAEK